MFTDPDQEVIERAYHRCAPVYDALCGPIFLNGRRAAAKAARQVGGQILEIGVGTGLSFDDYGVTTEITAVPLPIMACVPLPMSDFTGTRNSPAGYQAAGRIFCDIGTKHPNPLLGTCAAWTCASSRE